VSSLLPIPTEANSNFAAFSQIDYFGRSFVIGYDETGKYAVIMYMLSGRSEGSKNRVLKGDGGRIYTDIYTSPDDKNPRAQGDPSLLIYNVMMEANVDENRDPGYPGFFVVSNGKQTDDVSDAMDKEHILLDEYFYDSNWSYEPDHPHYTPRITGVLEMRPSNDKAEERMISIHIHRKSPLHMGCERNLFVREIPEEGLGYMVSTYQKNGTPLPPFQGEPLFVPLLGSAGEILNVYWYAMNKDTRVSLAVKFINLETLKSETLIRNFHTGDSRTST
jgi:IMP cyclohydrolase